MKSCAATSCRWPAVFPEEEIARLQESETPDKDFSRLWSLKEAYLKYMGSGLTEALNSFTVRKGKGAEAYTVVTSREQAAKVNLYHKRWDENYFLSICYGLKEKVTCIELLEIEKLLNFAKHYEE
ncbi:MAG: 4'-phosphopantetheinyl transferase superfamily protein [Bacteroidales bacterium]|nr:4'-phosphopantetheinyl transferase superfamily protein [Bacteroidales bacterium]